MNRIKETVVTLFLAARYSFSFCWKNSKRETIGRIIVSVGTTLLAYLTIQSTGLIINAVQKALADGTVVRVQSIPDLFRGGLALPIVFMLSILLVGAVLGRLQWFYRSTWNQKLRFANTREINEHRSTLDVARFRSKEHDDLSKRIQELPTSWQTRIWFSDEMFNLFATSVSFIIFGASLLWYKPIYALILFIMAIPMAIIEVRFVTLWWGLFQELVPHHKKRHMLEKPYHTAAPFVQALVFNQLPSLRKEIDFNVGEVLEKYNGLRTSVLRSEMLTHILSVVGFAGIAVHAIWNTVAFAGEIGTLTIILAAARTFQANLEQIVASVADQWNNAKGVILIEQDYFGLKPLIKTENPVVPQFTAIPTIRFEHVNFTYPASETQVLKDVSFEIEPGSKMAIVGQSGHGKSTLQALMMRHYDPTSGNIFINDINLRNIEPSVWCQTISALTQEYTVLERLVGHEIASSRLDQPVDLGRIIESSRFADFDEVVGEDPKGYESQIGVEFGGRDFSGGERQRLALARVHYRGTPILILDEPDAKLDPESAQKVIDQVFALNGITVIMITHHVSRAERCDKIIVMKKGEVAEQGTHTELMARDGAYASMFEKDKKRLSPKHADSDDDLVGASK